MSSDPLDSIETMTIPQSKLGAILWYGGKIINRMKAESQASINSVSVSDKDEREILIRGEGAVSPAGGNQGASAGDHDNPQVHGGGHHRERES